MAVKVRQRGRPTKPAKQGEKATLSLRVTADLKRRLDAAGGLAGRNLSEEAERRLDTSFRAADMLDQALDLAFGQPAAGLILLLARAMHDVGNGAGFLATGYFGGDGWLTKPYAFDQVVSALEAIIKAPRPDGDGAAPLPPGGAGTDWNPRAQTLGRDAAKRLLEAVAGQHDDSDLGQWAEGIRTRLGPQIVERIKQNLNSGEGSQNV
jgi:hypothetical protein